MILNAWTVLALFLAALGAGLGVAAGAIGLRGFIELRKRHDRRSLEGIEDRAHLLSLLMGVLTGVRLLAWPHLYIVMKSYVPALSTFGVMCVFGVTRIEPRLVSLLQAGKPLLLLGLGYWWLLRLADRRAQTRALLPGCLLLAIPLAGVALLECTAEVVYLLREKAGQPVTCCTQFLDTQSIGIASPRAPTAMPGSAARMPSLFLYYLLGIGLIGGTLHLRRRPPAEGKVHAVLLPLGIVALAICNLLVTRRAWLETIAPRVLQLPYHHCLYELLTDTPALGIAAVMTVAANGCLVWPLAMEAWKRDAPRAIPDLQRGIYGLSAVMLSSALLIVTVHLV